MKQIYYFDTYAILEVIRGSANYRQFKDAVMVTSRLNLVETFYSLLYSHGEKEARKYFEVFLPTCISISDEILQTAALFRFKNKGRKLSYFDCIGYQLALELNIKFLTGDKEFRDLENVEYVK